MALGASAAQTAATQWLERTLDDSVNRRLTLPQAFLGTDGVLRLAANIVDGLVVHPAVIQQNVSRELPFMATETILMAAVAQGGDRQILHERIRQHSLAVADSLKSGETKNDLIDRLAADPAFTKIDFKRTLDPKAFVGRAPEQVDEFIADVIAPIRQRYAGQIRVNEEINV